MTYKNPFRWLDPILVIGVLVSVAIALLMVGIGNDTISSLTIGFLSTIISLLIEVIARIQKSENSLIARIQKLDNSIKDQFQMSSKIISNKPLNDHIENIVECYELITKYEYEVFSIIAEETLNRCRTELQQISNGFITNSPDAIQEFGFRELQKVKNDVKVIDGDSSDFWESEFGKKYFSENEAALKRGVKITRIFALTDEDAKNNISILEKHNKAGINVLVLEPKYIKNTFMIFDEDICVYYEKTNNGEYIAECIDKRRVKVKEKIGEFNLLASHPRIKSFDHILALSKQ